MRISHGETFRFMPRQLLLVLPLPLLLQRSSSEFQAFLWPGMSSGMSRGLSWPMKGEAMPLTTLSAAATQL